MDSNIKSRMTELQLVIGSRTDDAQQCDGALEQVRALDNLKNCNRSAATVAFDASTTLENKQSRNGSVIGFLSLLNEAKLRREGYQIIPFVKSVPSRDFQPITETCQLTQCRLFCLMTMTTTNRTPTRLSYNWGNSMPCWQEANRCSRLKTLNPCMTNSLRADDNENDSLNGISHCQSNSHQTHQATN